MDQLLEENTLALILNIIIILALLSGRVPDLRSLFRSHLGKFKIEFDDQFAQHATKNAQIIVLLVIDRQEVKELACVPIHHSQTREEKFR